MIIRHKDFVSEVEFNDTETAKLIEGALPIEGTAQVWQEEVYFEIPVDAGLEDGAETVGRGDVAYWPNGRCFCIFFGKTQPISAVTIVGRVKSNLDGFRGVLDGDEIVLDND